MTRSLVHRGPDDEGYYFNGFVALGQRRLAIIDLVTGRQPMSNEDGCIWVTFNGEIYNFQELRARLTSLGHSFKTQSDTEAIVHGYEAWGLDCVRQFRGMFAFALWDERNRLLFLARDRLGKKPLYYTLADGHFLAASELQALLQHPGVRREVDPTALDDYLTYGYIPAPKTIFRGVYKLPPAHWLALRVLGGGGYRLSVERYWELAYEPKLALTEEEAIEGLEEVLTEAVRLRMIADVPLGALLSGGVDSSTIVALMARIADRPVQTFSIGFDEQDFNELAYARAVAERYGTDHHEMIVRPDALEVLPKLVRHYGEPYADSSAVPTYYVARMARQFVTVALNGDGGDECFAGYDRYAGTLLAEQYRQLPGWLQWASRTFSRTIPEGLPQGHRLRRIRRFLEAAALPSGLRYVRWVSTLPAERRQEIYTDEFRRELNGYRAEAWLLGLWTTFEQAGLHPLDLQLAVDVHSYLPYDLLVKMDIATMANSLEARSPFLDHRVMEFCARLPVHYKMKMPTLRKRKYLLKRMAERLVPAENLYRRKMGFGVPVGEWLRGPLRSWLQDALLSSRSRLREYFRAEVLQAMVKEHIDRRRDHTYSLWALLWLELWQREFMKE
jgi:asparagine synthase (glutamine-hydrolysing)